MPIAKQQRTLAKTRLGSPLPPPFFLLPPSLLSFKELEGREPAGMGGKVEGGREESERWEERKRGVGTWEGRYDSERR